jgi:hypothetical protein
LAAAVYVAAMAIIPAWSALVAGGGIPPALSAGVATIVIAAIVSAAATPAAAAATFVGARPFLLARRTSWRAIAFAAH